MRRAPAIAFVTVAIISSGSLRADDGGHASHHPAGGGSGSGSAMGAAPSGGTGTAPSGGMMDQMAGMMPPPPSGECTGGGCESVAGKNPIYPSLMTLPALTPEKRREIDALAAQQINEGMSRLATASELLHRSTEAGDNTGMQQAIGSMHEGLDELDAGVAARRVLAESKAPRNLALDWFKREMNLSSPIQSEEPRRWLGVTPFHLFTMVLLTMFGLAMVVMYFFKMRRAAALFGRLEGDRGKPPPGSAPPLTGDPGRATPATTPTAPASQSVPTTTSTNTPASPSTPSTRTGES